jgi:aminocarboxymuconate-semialdehyde decarboxylase
VTAIDIHFHMVPQPFIDAVRRHDLADAVEIEILPDGSEQLRFHVPAGMAFEPGPPVRASLSDEARILAGMDKRKLDAAALSTAPQLYCYWADPKLGLRVARAVNDALGALTRAHPDRFLPLATLPMQDGPLAAQELMRAVTELRLKGVNLCTHVNGIDLDHERFHPVYAMAEKLAVPIFLHPQNAGDTSRINDYHLWNLYGFPAETALAATRLIVAGVFEKFPGLNVVLAHGGGFFPYQIGRLDHGYGVRKELAHLPHPPSHYLKNIYCDNLVHNLASQRFLVDRLGADHVVLGTDHPFDMGTETPVDFVRELGLPREQEEAIIGGNLAKLLKVD